MTAGGDAGGDTGADAAGAGDDVLDVRGTFCPLPVLLTERRLRDLPPGARVTVVGDDPAIHGDVPAWCAESGHHLVALEELDGGDIRFIVEKAVENARSP